MIQIENHLKRFSDSPKSCKYNIYWSKARLYQIKTFPKKREIVRLKFFN